MAVVVSDLLPGFFDGVIAGLEDATDIVITVFHVFVDLVELLPLLLRSAKAVGHNSYAYLDFETSFGNDNDEPYQINVGMQWIF